MPYTNPTYPNTNSSAPAVNPNKRSPMLVVGSLLGLVILLGGLSFAVWRYVIKPASVADVSAYNVRSQNVPQTIGGSGTLFPKQQYDASSSTPEVVVAVNVKAGEKVNSGQTLVTVGGGQLAIQLKLAKDQVDSTQAFLNQVQVSGNANQIAAAQLAYNNALSHYKALQAQASSGLYSNGNINTPTAGVVTTVNVYPGQITSPNTPLVTVMDESAVILHAKVPLANLGQVQIGQKATVSPSALPSVAMAGTVSEVIPQADPQTDTFEVWVSVANPDYSLLPGMSAFAHIEGSRTALVLPRLTVLNQDSNPQVFIVGKDGHAHIRSVHIVARTADSIFVDNGVSAGDQVVLVGLDGLLDGQQLHVTKVEG